MDRVSRILNIPVPAIDPALPPSIVFEAARRTIVNTWRARRTTPRPDLKSMVVMEDPAPDWVWKLLDALIAHGGGDPQRTVELMHEFIAWCSWGKPEVRSAQVQSLIEHWYGPRLPMLIAFLTNARKTRAGRTRGAKLNSHRVRAQCGCMVRIRFDHDGSLAADPVPEAACDLHMDKPWIA